MINLADKSKIDVNSGVRRLAENDSGIIFDVGMDASSRLMHRAQTVVNFLPGLAYTGVERAREYVKIRLRRGK